MATFVRPDGCSLHYELFGPGQASPLILLEGMGGDIPGWRRNIPHLASEHRVIAYDFRGNGRSDTLDQPATMDTFVEDTLALLSHVGVDRAHVYGQSFGGMVAQEMALSRPERLASLVLGCTHAGARRAAMIDPPVKVPKDRPYLALYSERFAEEHPDHVAEDLMVASQNPQPPNARRRQWEAIQEWDAWDRLGAIRAPTLVLHGTDDRLISARNAQMLAERIPGATLILLEGVGHNYHSEQADAADRVVLDFLRMVDTPGGAR